MAAYHARFFVLPAFAAIVVAAGCDRAPARGPSTVTTTSGAMRPEARPSNPKTVDNSGFVDNAGRSSDERGRTEMSGMRATETGSERPTGTPGTGFPLATTSTTARSDREKAGSEGAVAASAPAEAVVGRFAQALCDYEMSCERIGKQKRWPSLATCVDKKRSVAREELADASCPDRYDPTAVASCLSAVRLASCDAHVERLQALPGCEPTLLCMRR